MHELITKIIAKAKFPALVVTEKGHKWLAKGHMWVYQSDLDLKACELSCPDYMNLQAGSLVDVFGPKANYLGTGFFNDQSKIVVRLLDRNRNENFTADFYKRRVQYALAYRYTIGALIKAINTNGTRLIFGEADGLPGLTVDLFGDVIVIERMSAGIVQTWPIIQLALLEELQNNYQIKIRLIYEKSVGPLREKEGLQAAKGVIYSADASTFSGDNWHDKFSNNKKELKSSEQVNMAIRLLEQTDLAKKMNINYDFAMINENGLKFAVDYVNGQKTGYFLDQRENRALVQKISANKRVLECFTHTGSFALNALLGGAQQVTAIDISQVALEQAALNAKLNAEQLDLRKLTLLKADVFDLLTALNQNYAGKDWDLVREKGPYDLILLDPPAFAKRREVKEAAYKGYLRINYEAMRLLPRGGYLVTTSCSHFMPDIDFMKMLMQAAKQAGVNLRLIARKEQAPDHPILLTMPETAYLKTYFLQII